jgi:L-aminopeptidase/D-esterase-like protein
VCSHADPRFEIGLLSVTQPLYPGSLVDVAGLAVGHAAAAGRPTGCSVVLCPEGAVAGVAQRGGAPGTRETDLLRPENTVQHVHAVLLSGGSAFGLDAATGVMRWLEERGHGIAVGAARVPIVPAAVLFDLWAGDVRIRPGAAEGYAACEEAAAAATTSTTAPAPVAASVTAPLKAVAKVAARATSATAGYRPIAQGRHGAALGATVGKLFGPARATPGGIGSASLCVDGVTVAALVAVNAVGDVLDEQGQVLAGALNEAGTGWADSTAALLSGAVPRASLIGRGAAAAGSATTIGVVATDATLSKAGATQLAGLAHHGLSRAISPVTASDGDTLFALATGRAGKTLDASLLGTLAAEVVARAIRNAVRASHAHASPFPPPFSVKLAGSIAPSRAAHATPPATPPAKPDAKRSKAKSA